MLTSVIATILLIYTRDGRRGPLSFTLPELMPVPGEEKANCFWNFKWKFELFKLCKSHNGRYQNAFREGRVAVRGNLVSQANSSRLTYRLIKVTPGGIQTHREHWKESASSLAWAPPDSLFSAQQTNKPQRLACVKRLLLICLPHIVFAYPAW